MKVDATRENLLQEIWETGIFSEISIQILQDHFNMLKQRAHKTDFQLSKVFGIFIYDALYDEDWLTKIFEAEIRRKRIKHNMKLDNNYPKPVHENLDKKHWSKKDHTKISVHIPQIFIDELDKISKKTGLTRFEVIRKILDYTIYDNARLPKEFLKTKKYEEEDNEETD